MVGPAEGRDIGAGTKGGSGETESLCRALSTSIAVFCNRFSRRVLGLILVTAINKAKGEFFVSLIRDFIEMRRNTSVYYVSLTKWQKTCTWNKVHKIAYRVMSKTSP